MISVFDTPQTGQVIAELVITAASVVAIAINP
jgi:hypothetical protein